MKGTPVAGVAIASVAIALCIFLPFLPGHYDAAASGVSALLRMMGFTGVLLVPFGALWLVAEHGGGLAAKRRMIARIGLGVLSFVWLLMTVAAIATTGFIFAAVVLAAGVAVHLRAHRRIASDAPGALPLHMVVLPLVSLALQFTVLDPVIERSRSAAIAGAAEMITHIEEYRASRGRYPISMQALHGDYLPGRIGTNEFRYEPNGESYNVFFEHPAKSFGMQEIVMYNPRDEHVFTSHAYDLIRRSPAELEMRRGFYKRLDASQPHWKYFWFD